MQILCVQNIVSTYVSESVVHIILITNPKDYIYLITRVKYGSFHVYRTRTKQNVLMYGKRKYQARRSYAFLFLTYTTLAANTTYLCSTGRRGLFP